MSDCALSADLQQAVASLDPKFLTVLLLVDAGDLSYGEVAVVRGVAIGTVTPRLVNSVRRCARRVRGFLEGTGVADLVERVLSIDEGGVKPSPEP